MYSGLCEMRREVRPGKEWGRLSMKDQVLMLFQERSRSVSVGEKTGIAEFGGGNGSDAVRF